MKPNDNFVRAGMAAFIPGMQYTIELMQRALDDLRAVLNGAEENGEVAKALPAFPRSTKGGTVPERTKRALLNAANGKQTNRDGRKIKSGTFWAKLTPEERSAEMKRRFAVSRKRVKASGAVVVIPEGWLNRKTAAARVGSLTKLDKRAKAGVIRKRDGVRVPGQGGSMPVWYNEADVAKFSEARS